jgi:hypothetical protein
MPDTFPAWAKPFSSYSRPKQPHNKVLHVCGQNVQRNLMRLLNNVDLNSSHVWLITEMSSTQQDNFSNKMRTDYPNWTLHWKPGFRTAILVHPSLKHTLKHHTDHICTIKLDNSDSWMPCMYGSNVSSERVEIMNELKSVLDKTPNAYWGEI